MQPYKRKEIDGRSIDEHRYIMEQHIGRRLNRNEYVHHINGNKRDNRIENLMIMSPQEHNVLHKEKLPKQKVCKVCGKIFAPPVNHRGRNTICGKECWKVWQKQTTPFEKVAIVGMPKDGGESIEFSSVKEASEYVGGLSTNIVKCARGKIKSAYGYRWEYSKKYYEKEK